jgi:5''-methylthioadenosine/S-adenosylhomocysteine nucleosidase
MKVVISSAFNDEVIYFIEKYNLDIKNKENIFKINNNEAVLINTGVGKVNSAVNLEKAITKHNPDFIINSGCSGAIDDSLPIYGVIISDTVFYHDFSPLNIMEKYMPENGYMKADRNLIIKAIDACKKLNIENYTVDNIATGDCYVTEKETVDKIKDMSAVTVDMESAALIHTAKINNVPFVSIRSISDFANGKEVDEIEASRKAAMITEEIINNI